ncbi:MULTISPECIES: hypothetical protein [Pseudomonas]|uniref:hypothetical protein n=1 Tax=Pseudomonas TaxID=286 RepID=UPI002F35DA62
MSDEVIAQAVPEIKLLINQLVGVFVQQLERWMDSKVLGGCCWGNSAGAGVGAGHARDREHGPLH